MSALPLRSPQLSGPQAPEARLRALLADHIPPESVPALLGALEEARAALWRASWPPPPGQGGTGERTASSRWRRPPGSSP